MLGRLLGNDMQLAVDGEKQMLGQIALHQCWASTPCSITLQQCWTSTPYSACHLPCSSAGQAPPTVHHPLAFAAVLRYHIVHCIVSPALQQC